MPNLLFYNDNNLILDAMKFDADQSVINDATLTAHFFLTDTGNKGSVTGVVNASPIAITSPGHGLTTGDHVVVLHVLGTPGAIGYWSVTVIDANSFSLDGSIGDGLWNRGGDWYRGVGSGCNLSMGYQTGTNGKYLAVVPFSLDRLPGEGCRLVILCSNYNYQLERDHTVVLRQ